LGRDLLEAAQAERETMVSFLAELASLESPSDVPATQAPIQERLTEAYLSLGFRVRKVAGRYTGGLLLAMPEGRRRSLPAQLLLGHCDTVWPLGTLATMPVAREGSRLRGPGVFDMKAGLAQMVFALRALRNVRVEPEVTVVVLVNSDEEIGSPESGRHIRRVARRVARVLIPEPSLGPEGRLKTARKGMIRFTVRVKGRAAHAGLDPAGGASAILQLSHLVQALHGLADPDRGITVNVGVVAGGTRPNVIAAEALGEVDVRVLDSRDAREVEARVRALAPVVPGTSLEIRKGEFVPPLERTSANRALWEAAREAARDLDLELGEGTAGGGSDGNLTSLYAATLDGLGAVGDGAHAAHEFIEIDRQVERTALLARLLLLPERG
jgi:glutamate carboxypeptidase